jgi:hypothetical protein
VKILVIDTWSNEVHIFEYPETLEQDDEAVEKFVDATQKVSAPFGVCHWQLFEDVDIKIHATWSVKE